VEAWEWLGLHTRERWVTWSSSRRESHLSFSIFSSTLENMGIPGSGKPMTMKCEKQQTNATETYCDANSKRGPTAGAFGPYCQCFLSTKSYVEQVGDQKGASRACLIRLLIILCWISCLWLLLFLFYLFVSFLNATWLILCKSQLVLIQIIASSNFCRYLCEFFCHSNSLCFPVYLTRKQKFHTRKWIPGLDTK